MASRQNRSSSDPGSSDPGRPAPGGSDPGRPAPGGSDPGRPAPGGSDPGRPAPGGSDPGRPAPGGSDPGRPAPGGSDPGRPAPGGSDPGRPAPGGSDPGRPAPGGSDPGRPAPGGSDPGRPAPGGSDPGRPAPGGSDPGRPAPGSWAPRGLNRRGFLRAGTAGPALGAGLLAGGAHADGLAGAAAAVPASYPFHGVHQAGVLTPAPSRKQNFACFAAFDSLAGSRAELAALMQTLTGRARFLTAGGVPPDLGIGAPPSDSDILGPVIPADGLTITVSAGASLFDDRYGLAARKPALLTPMGVFPNDSPEPAWLHGDLMMQVCAHHPDTVHHALRDIARHTRGAMQPRYRMDGFNSPPRPSGTSRNLLGFKDGTANPTGETAAELIWATGGREPAWARGGSYQVVRLIRMLVEFWDRVSINEQQNMFGRRRDSGAPLDGSAEFDQPDYAADPHGGVIPLDAHIRLANPRTAATAGQRIIRRSYNYDLGVDENGNMQAGHLFACYQQDLRRQFETIQKRLIGEPLVDYVQPFGGGYFFALPGVRDADDWYARGLLT